MKSFKLNCSARQTDGVLLKTVLETSILLIDVRKIMQNYSNIEKVQKSAVDFARKKVKWRSVEMEWAEVFVLTSDINKKVDRMRQKIPFVAVWVSTALGKSNKRHWNELDQNLFIASILIDFSHDLQIII